MRIALVSHTALYWTALYGRYLESRGHTVRIISFSREPLDGFDVEYVGAGTPTRNKALRYLGRVPRTASLLRGLQPDVVLATYLSSNGLVAALCRPRALVVSAHGSDVLGDGVPPRARAALIRFVCRRAAAVHVVSNGLAEALARFGVTASIERFPIGIDTAAIASAERQPRSAVTIVSTRRQEPLYDNETIVDALGMIRAELPQVRAVFLGGGPTLTDRREQVRALGLDDVVQLRGQVAPVDVRAAVTDADIYVSAAPRDGTSSSLLEAMAAGAFPVVSDIAANRDWVTDGSTGLLFRPGSAEDLARALRTAVRDPGLRARARETNRRRVVEEGDIAVNMARMEGLLERAAKAR